MQCLMGQLHSLPQSHVEVNSDHKNSSKLCTQLKNFIQRASFDPIILLMITVFSRAEEDDQDILSKSKARYILTFYVVGFVLLG